ncbi:MAG: hypothetical protein V4674_00470 [Patescibacteria group bacterium]
MMDLDEDQDIGSDYLELKEAEWAEDDPTLKQQLVFAEEGEGEIPDEHPFNDTALNVGILAVREKEERMMEEGTQEYQKSLEEKKTGEVEQEKINSFSPPPRIRERPSASFYEAPAKAQQEPHSWPVVIFIGVILLGSFFFVFPLFVVLVGGWIVHLILKENTPEKRAERGQKQIDAAYMRRDAEERRKAAYVELRRQIEHMPQYAAWRQGVFEKYGRNCIVCGSSENVEIDHRYMSFYAIIQRYGITTVMQAYECMILWDVNNGAPLCRAHHDQTSSSRYRAAKLS